MTAELTEAEDDFETAVGDPAAYYPEPQAIVADTTLSKAQKQRFLSEWMQDLSQRQSADSEGMAPDDSSTAAVDAALLKQVNAALADVEEQEPGADDVSTLRTVWKRLKAIVG